jgi:hypothetical protein
MEPLEQVTILMALMKRLVQVMDYERAILKSMRLDVLPDLQEEKAALAEAYEIEVARLRCSPDALAALEPHVRAELHEAMRGFQESMRTNLQAPDGCAGGGRAGAAQHRRQPSTGRAEPEPRYPRPGR